MDNSKLTRRSAIAVTATGMAAFTATKASAAEEKEMSLLNLEYDPAVDVAVVEYMDSVSYDPDSGLFQAEIALENLGQDTKYVELKQEIHHPRRSTENHRSANVLVPRGNILVRYDYEEISQAHCKNEEHKTIVEPHFGLPVGVHVSADLKSGPRYDRYRGWLKANVTIYWKRAGT